MPMLVLTLALAVVATEPSIAGPAETPSETADRMQTLYDQSCGQRDYAAFNDYCEQIAQQVRKARVEADRAAAQETKTARAREPATTEAAKPQR